MDIAINELAVRIGAMELIDQLCKGTSPLGPNMSLQESIIYTLDGTEAKLKDFIRNEALAVLMEQLFGRKKKEKKDPTTKDPTTELLDLLDMTLYRDNNDKVRP
jgi:hypothetical protein